MVALAAAEEVEGDRGRLAWNIRLAEAALVAAVLDTALRAV